MKCLPESARAPAVRGKPGARARPLIELPEASELSGLFKVLANDTRLRLLHALVRADEMCVNDLAAEVSMTPQAISNQLQRLSDRRVVACRREGIRLYYYVTDPCVAGLLDLGLCLLEEASEGPTGTRAASRKPQRSAQR